MTNCGFAGHEQLTAFFLGTDENSTENFFLASSIDFVSYYYGAVHKYVTPLLCAFGIFANIVHITILTRPSMKRSTVNRLLAFMACCDIVKMLSYFIYMMKFVLLKPESRFFAYPWIVYLLGHIVVSICLHSTSLYLSVCTAFIRFQAINQLQSRFMQPKIAWKIFVCVVLCVAVFCVPTFLVHKITLNQNVTEGGYTIDLPRNSTRQCALFMANLWITGIFFKVVPCCLLITFTILLLCKLHQNERRHEKIVSKDSAISRSARSDRTTLLLILLLAVFIVTELPQGFLAILNGIFPIEAHRFLYMPLGEILDLLSLINGNACFILYPCISSQYREAFRMMVARVRADLAGRTANAVASRPASSASHRAVKYHACSTPSPPFNNNGVISLAADEKPVDL